MSRNQHKNNKTPKESAQDAYIRSLYPMQVGIYNPVLRTPTAQIDDITPELLMLAQDMCTLMRLYNGTGLAAPQVGRGISLITMIERGGKGKKLKELNELIMINPRILSKSEKTVFSEESCLSIPDYTAYTRRSNRVSIVYTDIQGRERKRDFTDYNACVIQHEIDHLQGILFTDALVVGPGKAGIIYPPEMRK